MNQSEKSFLYTKKIGAFRPNFQGKPENYYTLTKFDVCCALFSCFGVVIIVFGFCIGLYFWSHNSSTDSLITVWSVILLVFIPSFMIAAFWFSKGKAEVEQELIKEALEKQIHKKQAKKQSIGKGIVRDEFGIQNRDSYKNDNVKTKDISILKSQSQMNHIVQQNSYRKTLGSYKPRFATKPQGQYQLYKRQICCAVSACVGIVLFFFSLCILLYIWSRYTSTKLLITICTIILIIFVPVFLYVSYEQSKDKLIKDEQLIKQALQRQFVSKQYKRQWSRQSVKVAAHLQYQFQD